MRLNIRLTIEHLKNLIFFSGPPPLLHPRDPQAWSLSCTPLGPAGLCAAAVFQKREAIGTVLFGHSRSGFDNLSAWEYQGICHFLGYQNVILNLTR